MVVSRKSSRRSVTSTKARKASPRGFVVCISSDGYEASLERNKIYVAIRDKDAERHGQVRVVDESGEDYLFAADRFVPIEIPSAVRASVLKAL